MRNCALCTPWPFAEDDEEPDGDKKMPAARNKPGTAATKAAGIFHQEQKHVQPSTVAAYHKLKAHRPQPRQHRSRTKTRRTAVVAKMLHDGDWTGTYGRVVLSQEDDEPPPPKASQFKGTAQVAQGNAQPDLQV